MAKIFCQNCGHQIDDSLSFCSSCGTPVKKAEPQGRSCAGCGAPLKDDQIFCGKCGYRNELVQEPVFEEPVVTAPVVEEVAQQVCSNCGEVLSEGKKFCPNCGKVVKDEEEVNTYYCSNCGREMRADQTFCSGCGAVKGQKVEPVAPVSTEYDIIKKTNNERKTSPLTEILRKVFAFTSLGLFLIGIVILLFLPGGVANVSLFEVIKVGIELLSDSTMDIVDFSSMMSVMLLLMFTIMIICMNISTVVGLFKINNVKREKFWKSVASMVTTLIMIVWYKSSVITLYAPEMPVTIFFVFIILINIMYIALYIIKLLYGEIGSYSFKSKRTGKLLACRILHMVALIVILVAYAFVSGSDFAAGEYGFKFFAGINNLEKIDMFSLFAGNFDSDPFYAIFYMFEYISTLFGLMFESAIIAGLIIGTYRLILADENDEATVGGFYGITGRQLIMGMALITFFRADFDIINFADGNSFFELYMDLLADTYLYIVFPYVGLLLLIIGFSIAHVVVHNKWLRENKYK